MPSVLFFTDVPFEGRGTAVFDILVRAGQVSIPPEHTPAAGESIRLVSVDGNHRIGGRGRIFERRIAAEHIHDPARMPAGRIIVGRFDSRGDALAISRPIDLGGGATARVWPDPPHDTADVLVVVEKPPAARRSSAGGVTMRLRENDGSREPDVLIDGFERTIAIWYGVTPGIATMHVASDSMFLPDRELRLRPGRVTTLRTTGRALPSARVSILVPDGSIPEDARLVIRRASDRGEVRRVEAHTGAQTLPALPAERLDVTLQLGRWQLRQPIDLGSGDDGDAAFDLHPLRIHGDVVYGDDPVPAEISFRNGAEWVRVETAEDGSYETTLWYDGTYTVRVRLKELSLPPWLEPFRRIEESGTVDFRIPRTDWKIRVVDASTGRGIAGAAATVGNIWIDDRGEEQTTVLRLQSDAEGVVVFPPLRSGKVHAAVRAEHYDPGETVDMILDDSNRTGEVEIRLRKTSASATLHIALAGGRGAAGAEVWAFDSGLNPLWRGVADGAGSVEIPDAADRSLLLVRHREGATLVRRWGNETAQWTLEPPTPPLTLVTGGSAQIAAWLEGVELTGIPLAIATWSEVASDAHGVWRAANLPPAPLRVLASVRGTALRDPSFAALATTIPFPWTSPVTIVPVD